MRCNLAPQVGLEHVDTAIASMLLLNRRACEEMLRRETHGCTDVTGFGLLGRAREMALAGVYKIPASFVANHSC